MLPAGVHRDTLLAMPIELNQAAMSRYADIDRYPQLRAHSHKPRVAQLRSKCRRRTSRKIRHAVLRKNIKSFRHASDTYSPVRQDASQQVNDRCRWNTLNLIAKPAPSRIFQSIAKCRLAM